MKKQTLFLGILLAMCMTGCQENPDSSIVVNKDMDKLIAQAEESGNGMDELSGNYTLYQTEFEDKALNISVKVDANVQIPDAEKMSVFRVRQAVFDQNFLNQALAELMGDGQIYDGSLLNIRTKKEILEEMKSIKNELAQMDEETQAVEKQEYEAYLAELQADYENAADSLTFTGYESDGKLHSTEEMKNQALNSEFYEWMYDVNPNGDIFYGIQEEQNGMYASITLQNNPETGNYLRFRKSRHGYEFTSAAVVQSIGMQEIGSDFWKVGEEEPKDMEGQTVEYTDESTTISEAEAVKLADAFIKNMGLDADFKYNTGGLYNEVLDIRQGELAKTYGYRKEWILCYSRKIENVFVTYNSTEKHEEGWVGDDYVKMTWPPEIIEIRVTDDGIVGVDYNAPLDIVETVVEASGLKAFEDIQKTFEKMVVVTNAEDYVLENTGTQVKIDQVILGYARISEANSYDTGLFVPVWDFIGTKTESDGRKTTGSMLTINAIDGSVIDRSVGY